ncbi:sensor histidine kinase N-terminal domain-containing protein [Roseivivax sp. CAU 1761]
MAEAGALRATLSLRNRVALAMAAVLLVGGALVLAAALAYGREAAREAYDRLLVGAARDIAAAINVRDGDPMVDMPVSAFALLALAESDRIRYRVTGPDGRTLTGDDAAPLPPRSGDVVYFDGAFGAEPARYVAVTRRFAERNFSGPVTVIVGQTLLARRDLARDIAQNAVLVLGGAGVAMALFAWLAVTRAMRPLSRIGATLAARDPSDLTPVALSAPEEVARLLAALNGFMGRLERQGRATRNLIGDAAHQLRTPVAAIRAQAQIAAREADPARQARIVSRIEARASGLGRLLDQLLSRALIIHRAEAAPRPRLDLRDIAVEVVEECDDLLAEAGCEVAPDLPEAPVWVAGDALSLIEAGKNLLTNAARHGRPPIRLGVDRAGGAARLWVRDAGDGPPPQVAARLGTRFAAAGASGGSGIGLAIAREVAEGHGGALGLSRGAGGFEIALDLPEARP